jgi:hypothetical protein
LIQKVVAKVSHEVSDIHRQDLELSPGDILMFRGDMDHAGDKYEIPNIRMFVYLDIVGVNRNPNETKVLFGSFE